MSEQIEEVTVHLSNDKVQFIGISKSKSRPSDQFRLSASYGRWTGL